MKYFADGGERMAMTSSPLTCPSPSLRREWSVVGWRRAIMANRAPGGVLFEELVVTTEELGGDLAMSP